MALRLTNGVLSFADGNIENLLRKLDGITRTFGHEASMPQNQRIFETETLPKNPSSCSTFIALPPLQLLRKSPRQSSSLSVSGSFWVKVLIGISKFLGNRSTVLPAIGW